MATVVPDVRMFEPPNPRFPEREETQEELEKLSGEDQKNFLDWAAQRDLDVSDLKEKWGVSEDDEDEGYDAMNVEELKEELKIRDLPVSGTKDELVARLEEDDEAAK